MDLPLLWCLLVVLSLGAANGRHLSTTGINIGDEEDEVKSGFFLELDKNNATQRDELINIINQWKSADASNVNRSFDEADLFCTYRAKRIADLKNATAANISASVEELDKGDSSASRGRRTARLDDAREDDSEINGPQKFSLHAVPDTFEEDGIQLEDFIIISAAAENYCAKRAVGTAGLEELSLFWNEVNATIKIRATNDSYEFRHKFFGSRGKRSVELEDEVEDKGETRENVSTPVASSVTLMEDDEDETSPKETGNSYDPTDEESVEDVPFNDTLTEWFRKILKSLGILERLADTFFEILANKTVSIDSLEYPDSFNAIRGKRSAELENELQHDSSPEETEIYITLLDDDEADSSPNSDDPTDGASNAVLEAKVEENISYQQADVHIHNTLSKMSAKMLEAIGIFDSLRDIFLAARGKRNTELEDEVQHDSSPEGTDRYIPTYVKRNAELNNKVEDGVSDEDAIAYNQDLVLQILGIPSNDNRLIAQAQKAVTRTKRIAGGIDAKEKEFPYQVSLRFNGLHICGGALISGQHVLTAAHCICGIIDEPYDDLTVVTGSVRIDKGGKSHLVKTVHCHNDFVFGLEHSWQDDIAVVTLNDTVPFDDAQSPVKLPSSDAAVNQRALITGWGKSETQGYLHKNLQKLAVNIISNEECQGYYNNSILSSQLCSFNGQGSGACKGDSGSPLVSNGTIIGVFSWTNPCALGSPEVYSNVRFFSDFIERSMKDQDSINPITDHKKIGVNVRVSNGTGDSVGNDTDYLTLVDHGAATVTLV